MSARTLEVDGGVLSTAITPVDDPVAAGVDRRLHGRVRDFMPHWQKAQTSADEASGWKHHALAWWKKLARAEGFSPGFSVHRL